MTFNSFQKIFSRIFLLLNVVAIFFCIISYIFIRFINENELKSQTRWLTDRVTNDLRYLNGKWDTSIYLADPYTPYPAGNGGFGYPLYIVTKEGFVIERNMPINGLLDSSSLSDLLTFQKPQTISALTNEHWRVLSKPIKNNDQIIGGILVSEFNPKSNNIAEIDEKLVSNINKLISNIKIRNNEIDISSIDILDIDYEISVQITDSKNKLLLSNGRVPSYIDPVIVKDQFNKPSSRVVKDAITKESFVVESSIIFDTNKNPVGIVLHARSMQFIIKFLNEYIIFLIIGYLFIFIPTIFYLLSISKKEIEVLFNIKPTIKPKYIIFDSKKEKLLVDKIIVEVPVDSYQYMLCEVLFSDPGKKWPEKVFFQKFNTSNWRSVYDAFLAINKKTQIHLILHKDKNYFINPEYVSNLGFLK